ncbi:hypothetical protein [Antribacter gilvus]|uniref:hypothetical protein n=1 Tax=Antribacter gilvus TaxID=2304675 RepID=UPI000F776AC6|nr:hypothetical protein [Antribacter gilvus]
MRVFDDEGAEVDSTFMIEVHGDDLSLVVESRGGTVGTASARNTEYTRGFTILLRRLSDLGATVTDAAVDSRGTKNVAWSDRRLSPVPARLGEIADIDELAKALMRSQGRVGQEPGAKGGNTTRRMRLLLDVPGYTPDDATRLERDLAHAPAPEQRRPGRGPVLAKPKADDDLPATYDGPTDLAVRLMRRGEQPILRRGLLQGRTEAPCALCGEVLPVNALWAAHIKRRSACTEDERRDLANVAMLACLFGCDWLFELGYITGADGHYVATDEAVAPAISARLDSLDGRAIPGWDGRASYFAWHREHVFRGRGATAKPA